MFTLLEAAEPPGFGPPLHIHHGIAEAFLRPGGQYVIFLDGDEIRCPTGSFIFSPAQTPHGFRVGDVQSRKLNLYLPASMVGYLDDLSDAMKTGEADSERSEKGLDAGSPVLYNYLVP
ncbi:MAG: hypothetical protein ABI635_01840 [Actinomycetota bacterium]